MHTLFRTSVAALACASLAATAYAAQGKTTHMAQGGMANHGQAKRASAGPINGCAKLPSHDALRSALRGSVKPSGGPSNGGFDLNMWGVVVDRGGIVCEVVFTGNSPGDQWPGSRAIAAQKANTANAFSLPGLALSTANLFTPVQPGKSLYGLQHSNPIATDVLYKGSFDKFGSKNDPMVGGRIGGVNVFGGGLALYTTGGDLIGALGVSGDSSCADHNVAWRTRKTLGLDHVPGGVSPAHNDAIVYGNSPWAHPTCGGTEPDVAKAIGSGAVIQ